MSAKSDSKSLKGVDHADLFLRMSLKEENREEAEDAFSLFYETYKDFLYTLVRKVCSSWNMYGDDLIFSVFQNTFLTVYMKAEKLLWIDEVPLDKQEYKVKASLAIIAKNEMYQILREEREDKENIVCLDDLSVYSVSTETKVEGQQPSSNLLLLEKALSSLSERDRHILMTYLMFEDGNKKLPREEIQKLGDLWEVHPDNLRQIKKRSLEKVKKYVESYNHLIK